MAVTFISNGYDTTPEKPYGEGVWADSHPTIGLASYGVRSPTDWKVTAVSGQDRTVSIAAGRGFGHGVTDKTVANDTIQLDTITSGSRWDLIACRRDWTPTAGVSQFVKVNGGATAVIPGGRLASPGGIDDQPLALVQVTAGQTQPTGFIDLRTWSGDGGGLIGAHDLVRSYLNQVGTRIWIDGKDWVRRAGANDTPEWVRSIDTTVPTTTPGWSLAGSLVRSPATNGSQISAAFMCTYSGGAFSIGQTFIRALTLTNAGYLPSADVFGYILVLSAANVVRADGAFNINSSGELYIRMFSGSYTIQPTDKFYISANWNAS